MSMSSHSDPTDDRLIRRHLDGELSDDEFAALNQRLLSDPAFRRRFIELSDLESAMGEMLATGSVRPSEIVMPSRSAVIRAVAISVVVTTVVALILFAGLNRFPKQTAETQIADTTATEEDESAQKSALLTDVAAAMPAAVVTATNEEFDGAQEVGDRLMPGMLSVSRGQLQIEFMSGAVVALEGPAEIQIESQTRATLKSGRATAKVPDRARGFMLNGPNSAVVDLGTEFQMSVDPSGVTDIAVTDGEIELSLLGDDGNTLVSQRMTESGSVRLDRTSEAVDVQALDDSISFPSISNAAKPLLVVPAEYVEQVRRLNPVVYWQFEDPSAAMIRNGGEAAHDGVIRQGSVADSLVLTDGCVEFRREEGVRFIQTEEAIDELGVGPVSFEFWMRPDDLQHATCLGVFPDNERPGVTHLNVVEIVTNTFLVHEPGAVRFLVRSPPGEGPKDTQEINAFTPSMATPGRWQHVVAVWNESEIRLYFNGRLQRLIDVDQPRSPGRFHVIIGQLKPHRNERQFSGALDEVAVYRQALSDDDVKRHFDIISKQNHGRLISETSR